MAILTSPTTILPDVVGTAVSLDIVDKYTVLSKKILDKTSIYMRAKDTFKEMMDDQNISPEVYAKYAGDFVSQLATNATTQALEIAYRWAKDEKEMPLVQERQKADIDAVHASTVERLYTVDKLRYSIEADKLQMVHMQAQTQREYGTPTVSIADNYTLTALADTGQVYTNIKATEMNTIATKQRAIVETATSLRKNGKVATWDASSMPETMEVSSTIYSNFIPDTVTNVNDLGSDYLQSYLTFANSSVQHYTTLADSYRKNGIVRMEKDIDTYWKGTSSGTYEGYTRAQELFAIRQTDSFDDSMRSHALSGASQMIGQLLATEVVPSDTYLEAWLDAMSHLNGQTYTLPA